MHVHMRTYVHTPVHTPVHTNIHTNMIIITNNNISHDINYHT